jgi:hypothetical protein
MTLPSCLCAYHLIWTSAIKDSFPGGLYFVHILKGCLGKGLKMAVNPADDRQKTNPRKVPNKCTKEVTNITLHG